MTAASRPSAGLRSAALLGCLAAMGLPLAGCAPADPEPEIPEMEQPPNREIAEPGLVAGAELPVWARSADCNQPRPSAEDDGLARTAPAPDAADVAFVVPQTELALCELPGVVSASVEGSYSQGGEAREGTVDLGLLFAPEATPEQIAQAWSSAETEAEAQLSGTGIGLGQVSLVLDDGSSISGPAEASSASEPAAADGRATGSAATIPEAIDLLAALQRTGPQPGAQETAAPDPSASPSSAEEQGPERRWSVSVGQQLEVTTVYSADLSAEGALPQFSRVLRDTQEAGQAPGGHQVAVTVIDGRVRLTVPSAFAKSLTPELLEDLHDLGQVPDLQATARVEGSDGAAPMLRVRSERLPEYSEPQYEEAAEALSGSAAEAGMHLDHRLDGEPLPLDEEQAEAQD